MIKNTHKAVMDYAEAIRQATEVYKQAESYIKANYKEDSDLYKSAMKTASETFRNATKPLNETYRAKVTKDFEEVRKAIQKVVTVPPTVGVVNLMPVIQSGQLGETEKQMILEEYKGNYMDSKLLHHAMGLPFTTIENMMEDLSDLEAPLKDYFDGRSNEYMTALMKKGDWIKRVDDLTDGFLNTYSVQDSNK